MVCKNTVSRSTTDCYGGLLQKKLASTQVGPLCIQNPTGKGRNKNNLSDLDNECESCCLSSSRVCLYFQGTPESVNQQIPLLALGTLLLFCRLAFFHLKMMLFVLSYYTLYCYILLFKTLKTFKLPFKIRELDIG